ncbi:TrbC/VirB2 family protein [Dyella flava]|uniref:TrbC/VirB2 family protein n=2 Tax=Dyella flava TaxID=1920170 RepID=A0ABS2K8M4_9GAMM|nr:TrbC/VirB2 family protein [Dyella flava]
MVMLMLCVASAMVLVPDLAHATDVGAGTGQDSLPFETPLKNLGESLSGPVAFSISLIGIVAAGAILIFGGELSGFMRSMVFLVLVIAVLVNASYVIKFISSDAATIAMRGVTVHGAAFLQGLQVVLG